jgi:hypothetical protein
MPPRSKVAMLPPAVRDELERRLVERGFSGYEELAKRAARERRAKAAGVKAFAMVRKALLALNTGRLGGASAAAADFSVSSAAESAASDLGQSASGKPQGRASSACFVFTSAENKGGATALSLFRPHSPHFAALKRR